MSIPSHALHWLADLPITRLHMELQPQVPWRLGPQPAVMLRGAMGNAFMHQVCVQDTFRCRDCAERSGCLVTAWYDPGLGGSARVRPYVHRVLNAPGSLVDTHSPLRWRLTLLGPIPRPSALLEAVCKAARTGLGRDRVRHLVRRVWVEGAGSPSLVVEDDRWTGVWPDPAPLVRFVDLPSRPRGASILLTTRLQLVKANRQPPVDVSSLLRASVLRVRAIGRSLGISLERWWPSPARVGTLEQALGWQEMSRFGQRQGRRIDLSGYWGVLRAGPDIAPFADLLAAMEVLHVGRNTSAGLGCIEVDWDEEPTAS